MNKVAKRKIFIAFLLLIVLFVGSRYFLKDDSFYSKNIKSFEVNNLVSLNFNVNEPNAFMVKIVFDKNGGKNINELFSLPVSLTYVLKDDKGNALFFDSIVINGVSGEDENKNPFREINTFYLNQGKYSFELNPLKDELLLNKFNPKIVIKKVKIPK